jgi:hypothetical protein
VVGKLLRLVPNPSSDRKALEFEGTLFDLLEQCYEGLADTSQSIRRLSTQELEGVPVERAVLQSLVAHADRELPKITKLLAAVRQRKAAIQKALKASAARTPRQRPTRGGRKRT